MSDEDRVLDVLTQPPRGPVVMVVVAREGAQPEAASAMLDVVLARARLRKAGFSLVLLPAGWVVRARKRRRWWRRQT